MTLAYVQMAGFDLFSGGPQHPMDIDITIADGRPEIVGRTAGGVPSINSVLFNS
jgi:hypothetical protein